MADSSDVGNESSPRLEKGLQLLFAAEVAEEAVDAVDLQALRAGAAVEEAVDPERLGSALGRPVGRALAQRAVGDAAEGYVGVLVREAVGRAGARACRVALERVDAEALALSLPSPVSGFASNRAPNGDD
jgi:hypothetical protein